MSRSGAPGVTRCDPLRELAVEILEGHLAEEAHADVLMEAQQNIVGKEARVSAVGVEDAVRVAVGKEHRGRFREPRDGEGVWLRLAVLMADGAELRAERGRFAFSAAS